MAIIVTQVCKKNATRTAFLSLCNASGTKWPPSRKFLLFSAFPSLSILLSQHVKMCITSHTFLTFQPPGRRRQLFISIYSFLCGQRRKKIEHKFVFMSLSTVVSCSFFFFHDIFYWMKIRQICKLTQTKRKSTRCRLKSVSNLLNPPNWSGFNV